MITTIIVIIIRGRAFSSLRLFICIYIYLQYFDGNNLIRGGHLFSSSSGKSCNSSPGRATLTFDTNREEIVPRFRSRNRCHQKRARNGPLTESSIGRNGEAAEGSEEAEELEEEISPHFSSVFFFLSSTFKRPCFRFGEVCFVLLAAAGGAEAGAGRMAEEERIQGVSAAASHRQLPPLLPDSVFKVKVF